MTAERQGRPLRRLALALAGAVVFALFAWWLDRRMLGVAPDAYFGAFRIFANAVPGLLVALLLTALTRRPLLSLLLVAGLQLLVYVAGTIKLNLLNDPLGLQDLYFVSDLSPDSIALLGHYVAHPWLLAAAVVATIGVFAVLWRLERPAFRALRATQLVLFVVAVALGASLVAARQPWVGLYDKDWIRPSRFAAMPAVLRAGLMSSLVYTHLRNSHAVGEVNEAALAGLFRLVPSAASPATPATTATPAVRPDIVVILSESLFDPRIMKGMDDLPDAIPNVRAALAAGDGGYMTVPAFGGGTVRPEFEVLTGMPVKAFPDAHYPYISLLHDRIPGLVSAVEKHGYKTVAIHGNAGSFWNRRNAYKAMGFDRFITRNEFPPDARRDGMWISDAVMTDLILDQLRERPDPAPKLVMALSIETHGPYTDAEGVDAAERDAIQVPAALPPADAESLRNYLYHAHHADAGLGRLMREVRASGRPTIVLFFGDHLPALPKVYARLGFDDGRSGPRQQVPWVLWRSDSTAPTARKGFEVDSWMMPALVLQLAGIHDDPYFEMIGEAVAAMASATPAEQRTIVRGMMAAGVARIDGSFGRRRTAGGQPHAPSRKAAQ